MKGDEVREWSLPQDLATLIRTAADCADGGDDDTTSVTSTYTLRREVEKTVTQLC